MKLRLFLEYFHCSGAFERAGVRPQRLEMRVQGCWLGRLVTAATLPACLAPPRRIVFEAATGLARYD